MRLSCFSFCQEKKKKRKDLFEKLRSSRTQEEMQPADLSAVDRTQRVLDVKCQMKKSPFSSQRDHQTYNISANHTQAGVRGAGAGVLERIVACLSPEGTSVTSAANKCSVSILSAV